MSDTYTESSREFKCDSPAVIFGILTTGIGMIRLILDAFSKRIYKIQGFEQTEDSETIIIYGHRNKRTGAEYRKLAAEIAKDRNLREQFDYDDYTEIVSFAQRDKLIGEDVLDQELLPTYQQARRAQYQFFPYLVALTAVVWCFASIIGHRFMFLQFEGVNVNLPGAILIFPIIYFLADLIQEVYGYSRARQTLWVCIFVHVVLGILVSLVLSFNPSPYVDNHAYVLVLATQWRMIVGNAIGMIAGFTANGIILAKLKIRFEGKKLWLRSIGSTLIAEIVYSVVCSSIAFNDKLSINELVKLQIGMVVIKAMWEMAATPVLYLVSSYIKNKEGQDVYDRYTNFNPFSLSTD